MQGPLTPLILHLARRLRFDPVPHLIGLATAANIGSTATITGNPLSINIGAHSGISYVAFAARLMPVAILGLAIDFRVIALVCRRALVLPAASSSPKNNDSETGAKSEEARLRPAQIGLQRKSAVVAMVTVALFFTGLPLELIALGAASVLLLGHVRPEKVYREVDWSLLLMFTGLFIVVHAFQVHVVSRWDVQSWTWLLARPVDLLSLVSAGLSNVVSNVPVVLLLEPVVRAIPSANRETAWLALAMSSTLAGNLTVLGSVANLIVVEQARREGVTVSFADYCKVGIPVTILTLLLGIAWLMFVPY